MELQNQIPDEPKPKRAPRELTEKQLEAKKLRDEIRQQEVDVRSRVSTIVVLRFWLMEKFKQAHIDIFACIPRNAMS